jgi:hypothetical protein
VSANKPNGSESNIRDYATSVKNKSKSIPVTGRLVLKNCEISRIPHFLDSGLTYGSHVIRLMHRPRFTTQETFPPYSILLEAE